MLRVQLICREEPQQQELQLCGGHGKRRQQGQLPRFTYLNYNHGLRNQKSLRSTQWMRECNRMLQLRGWGTSTLNPHKLH